uniref:MFS domain-containing protein n=1 Tax=Trichobilharzia regenti TaxID=157069 RepID=A0AA85IM11_TRIRE|nr:unnamed protein product [Trichobilharzia regenti]
MVSMLSIFKRSHLKQSTNLVILCFFLYKLTETLLQYGTRIEIYKTVCIALTNFTKPNENFCSDENYVNEKQQDTRNYEMLTKVQKASGIYLLIYRILLNLPAAIACLIYGVCSNKFGRKISMLIPCLGATIACTLFSASLSPEINLIYGSTTLILIGGTIYGICGKSSAVTMGANSYITDMSSTSNRTRMLGRLLGVNCLGLTIGTVLFNQMTKSGEQDIILLYLRNKPTLWTSQLYGFYMACYYGCMFLHLTLFLPIIEHRYTPHDTTLILIGLSLKIFRLLLFSITMNKFWIFFGAIIGSAAGYITSATRSLISKLVKGDEIGASFALISIMETIANLFGGMLFTLVYNYTLNYISSFILLFDAFLHILVFILIIWLRFKFLIYEKSSNNIMHISQDFIDQS